MKVYCVIPWESGEGSNSPEGIFKSLQGAKDFIATNVDYLEERPNVYVHKEHDIYKLFIEEFDLQK